MPSIVPVDFNNVVRNGLVRASTSRASGFLTVGDVVTAVDSREDMSFAATVAAVEGARVYLRVNWDGP